MIIHRKFMFHFEWHRGLVYNIMWVLPRLSFRPAQRAGDIMEDGGELGVLIPCPRCATDGLLHQPFLREGQSYARTARPTDRKQQLRYRRLAQENR